jgi:hypothetical protein
MARRSRERWGRGGAAPFRPLVLRGGRGGHLGKQRRAVDARRDRHRPGDQLREGEPLLNRVEEFLVHIYNIYIHSVESTVSVPGYLKCRCVRRYTDGKFTTMHTFGVRFSCGFNETLGMSGEAIVEPARCTNTASLHAVLHI